MKPVYIDFVPPRAWKVIWLIAAVFMLSIAGLTGWQVWKQRQVQVGLQAELELLQAELRLRTTPTVPVVNPREASEKAAQRLLRRDWNKLFDAVENPELSQVRLVQLSFDADTGQARLEYEMDNIAMGAGVTTALNERGDGVNWLLERLSSGAAGSQGGNVRGVWRGQLP